MFPYAMITMLLSKREVADYFYSYYNLFTSIIPYSYQQSVRDL